MSGHVVLVALRNGAPSAQGDNVLVLGATGSAGRLAVQIAKLPRSRPRRRGAGRDRRAGWPGSRASALRDQSRSPTSPRRSHRRSRAAGADVHVVIYFSGLGNRAGDSRARHGLVVEPSRPLFLDTGRLYGRHDALAALGGAPAATCRVLGSGQARSRPPRSPPSYPALAASDHRRQLRHRRRSLRPSAWSSRVGGRHAARQRIVFVCKPCPPFAARLGGSPGASRQFIGLSNSLV